MSSTEPARSWTVVVAAVARHPELWATAAGQVFRLSPTGWWRRAPYLPVPDPGYVAFRVATQEGGVAGSSAGSAPPDARPPDARPPDARDVVEYLRWCRSLARST